jgi:hypothetical protein
VTRAANEALTESWDWKLLAMSRRQHQAELVDQAHAINGTHSRWPIRPHPTRLASHPTPVPGRDRRSSPDEQGMDPRLLDRDRSTAFSDGMNTQGFAVVQSGVSVAGWYAEVADEGTWVS